MTDEELLAAINAKILADPEFDTLGSARSIVTGPLTITWNASGILTLNQA